MNQTDDAAQWLQKENDRLQSEQTELQAEIRKLTLTMATSSPALYDTIKSQLTSLCKQLHGVEMTLNYIPFNSLIDELSAQRQAA